MLGLSWENKSKSTNYDNDGRWRVFFCSVWHDTFLIIRRLFYIMRSEGESVFSWLIGGLEDRVYVIYSLVGLEKDGEKHCGLFGNETR